MTASNPPTPAPREQQPRTGSSLDESASAELFVRLQPGDSLEKLLARAGVAEADAATAGKLLAAALPGGLAPGTEVAVLLGESAQLRRVAVRTGLELKLTVARQDDGALRLHRDEIAVDSTPLRFAGRAGSNLYWSLRSRGVPARAAGEFVSLVSSRVDVTRELVADDRFDLVLAHRRASTGETSIGPLLYAAVDRRSGNDVQLVNWTAGGRSGWFDANGSAVRSASWTLPLTGRVSSPFGARVHPILRFVRFHRGIDLAAPWGTPIVAAADGRVVGAGWNGGHGRQVRIAHSDGLETSYSHMSQIAAQPGSFVRRGQLIGHVGSSGFSTGPHLHYEVREGGRAVDPLRLRHSTPATLSAADRASIRARLRQLLATDA